MMTMSIVRQLSFNLTLWDQHNYFSASNLMAVDGFSPLDPVSLSLYALLRSALDAYYIDVTL